MSFTKYRILIFSENPDQLMKFYRDVLGFMIIKSGFVHFLTQKGTAGNL